MKLKPNRQTKAQLIVEIAREKRRAEQFKNNCAEYQEMLAQSQAQAMTLEKLNESKRESLEAMTRRMCAAAGALLFIANAECVEGLRFILKALAEELQAFRE